MLIDRAVLTKTILDEVQTFTYDTANQVLSENNPLSGIVTWSYDPNGNRLSQDATQSGVRTITNWAYDPADEQITQTVGSEVTTYSFDANGNQQVIQTNSGRTTYAWDYENRLVGSVDAAATRTTMSYEAQDGLRWELDEGDGSGKRRMLWDRLSPSGSALLAELNDAGVVRNYYRGALLAALTEAAGRKQYHFDDLDSAQALTGGAGSVTDRWAGNAWGVQLKRSGTSGNRQWYLGDRGFYRQADGMLNYAALGGYYAPALAVLLGPLRGSGAALCRVRAPLGPNPSGAKCPSAACPVWSWGALGLSGIDSWLNRMPPSTPQCDPVKLACTMKLLEGIAVAGRLWDSPISGALLQHWLEGTGSPVLLDFGNLLKDAGFHALYEKMIRDAIKAACTQSGFNETLPGLFDRGDLGHSIHAYYLTVQAWFHQTGVICPPCAHQKVQASLLFRFHDTYDWNRNTVGSITGVGTFKQAWFDDLSLCCSNCCKSFDLDATRALTLDTCC